MLLIKQRKLNKEGGVTLIEIVITILIMSIGLLGMAALQNTSLKLSYDSYLRTQAAFLAYDLIDRIRANPDTDYQLGVGANPGVQNCFAGANCSPEDLKDYDLYYWKQQADALLPDATLELQKDNATNTYSMRLGWDDRYEEDLDQTNNDETKEFVYHFQVDGS